MRDFLEITSVPNRTLHVGSRAFLGIKSRIAKAPAEKARTGVLESANSTIISTLADIRALSTGRCQRTEQSANWNPNDSWSPCCQFGRSTGGR
jgi:hypothetical protein